MVLILHQSTCLVAEITVHSQDVKSGASPTDVKRGMESICADTICPVGQKIVGREGFKMY